MANLPLYIKRAELSQNENYIKNVFKNYGVIDRIEFIEKSNDNGQKYNGVIIYFLQWNFNNIVEQLWTELHANKDVPTKIFHGPHHNKFWIVTQYKLVEPSKPTIIQSNISIDLTDIDEKAIKIIHDLQFQIQMLEKQLQKKEQFCMQNELNRMNACIQATASLHEIQDKDIQYQWLLDDFHSLQKHNSLLIKKNTLLMNDNRDLKNFRHYS